MRAISNKTVLSILGGISIVAASASLASNEVRHCSIVETEQWFGFYPNKVELLVTSGKLETRAEIGKVKSGAKLTFNNARFDREIETGTASFSLRDLNKRLKTRNSFLFFSSNLAVWGTITIEDINGQTSVGLSFKKNTENVRDNSIGRTDLQYSEKLEIEDVVFDIECLTRLLRENEIGK